jgi:hypothetical protein
MATADTLAIFTPRGYEPPTSNYATLDTRNAHVVLDFDTTTQETAIWSGVMPYNYGGGNLTVYVHSSMTSATSSDIWQRPHPERRVHSRRCGDGQHRGG